MDKFTYSNEGLLRKYWHDSKLRAQAHLHAETYYRAANRNYMRFPATITATLGTILGSVSFGQDECGSQTVQGLWITTLILTGVTMILNASQNVLDFDLKRERHHESFLQYSDCASDIELYLQSDFKEQKITDFIKTTHEKLDIYGSSEVEIAKRFMEQAKQDMRNGTGKLLKPLSSMKLHRIQIDPLGETELP